MVYNLKQDGWRKGVPVMTNDIAVTIEAQHLPADVQSEIARVICVALNRELVNTHGANADLTGAEWPSPKASG